LTDVANLVELAETGVGLKRQRMAFPGQVVLQERRGAPRLDAAYLARWISQYMVAVNL
jgi:hypothetical protein